MRKKGFAFAMVLLWSSASSVSQQEPAPEEEEAFNRAYCSGRRMSKDVIIYLGQKQHSSYDATHRNTLNASMASLALNYRRGRESDVIVWHEGDLSRDDANALESTSVNVRFCLLANATGWSVPKFVDPEKLPPMVWSLGYRKMIRFYAVTVWPTLKKLGYDWVMRMDDDSFILSPIKYNLFEAVRDRNDLYAYRMLSAECPRTFSEFVRSFASSDDLVKTSQAALFADTMKDSKVDVAFISMCTKFPRHCRAPQKRQKIRDELAKLDINAHPELVAFAISKGMPYCAAIGQYGYYNNFFITSIDWWLTEPNVSSLSSFF